MATRDKTEGRTKGQYTYSSLEVLCVCGHTLGQHAANLTEGLRECFVGDGDDSPVRCACVRFKKAKK